ncbi:MAG: hypothetical protein IPF53_12205 [Blastocatellia bacterium]|nr:hypothetical protein [Blastocatellia bacterium]
MSVAPRPHVAVANLAGERRNGPARGFDWNDIEVVEQDERSLLPGPREVGDDVGAVVAHVEDLARDALAIEDLLEEVGGAALVAGRIRGVDADVLLQHRRGFLRERVEVRRRRRCRRRRAHGANRGHGVRSVPCECRLWCGGHDADSHGEKRCRSSSRGMEETGFRDHSQVLESGIHGPPVYVATPHIRNRER